jgi:hypothetical protein
MNTPAFGKDAIHKGHVVHSAGQVAVQKNQRPCLLDRFRTASYGRQRVLDIGE